MPGDVVARVGGGLETAPAAGSPSTESPETPTAPDVVAEFRSQAARLVDLAADAELFHTPDGDPFATVAVANHRETHPVRGRGFKGWLRHRYWDAYHQPANGTALADALETLAAQAEFGGEAHPVAVRVADHDGRLYVDLANDAWQAVEIHRHGWQIVDAPPVKFRRPATMEPLPMPVHGGSLEELRPFVNVTDEDGWHLFAGYLVAAFRPSGPYLVLVVYGEQGSAKSTTSRLARLLVDPARSALRSEPRDQQDLLIAARNNWVMAFDNISHLQPWLSDAVCRVSTGGGLGKRQLYTDQDEIVLDAQRPQILNGITEFATRGDLLDRSIIHEQPVIDDSSRRSEEEFWAAFEVVRPRVMGALLDAVVAAHADEAGVVLAALPRMADPTCWVTAAEPALGWKSGTFAAAYRRNRREGSALALDAALIAGPIRALADRGDWQGTASALLSRVAELAGPEITDQRAWPKGPRALTEALKRLAPDLRAMGIEWRRLERTGTERLHAIRGVAGATVTTVTTVTASAESGDSPATRSTVARHGTGVIVTADRAPGDGDDGHDGSDPHLRIPGVGARAAVPPTASGDEESTTWTA